MKWKSFRKFTITKKTTGLLSSIPWRAVFQFLLSSTYNEKFSFTNLEFFKMLIVVVCPGPVQLAPVSQPIFPTISQNINFVRYNYCEI
jgi:hypothetical protein